MSLAGGPDRVAGGEAAPSVMWAVVYLDEVDVSLGQAWHDLAEEATEDLEACSALVRGQAIDSVPGPVADEKRRGFPAGRHNVVDRGCAVGAGVLGHRIHHEALIHHDDLAIAPIRDQPVALSRVLGVCRTLSPVC